MLLSVAATSCGSPTRVSCSWARSYRTSASAKPILPVQDVAGVAVEPGEAEQIAVALVDRARLRGRRQRLVVAAEADQALQRAVQRARDVDVAAQAEKHVSRRVVMLQRLLVLAPRVMDVTDGAQALRAARLVTELLGDPVRGAARGASARSRSVRASRTTRA